MSWDGRGYYYRSVRCGDRVIRQYVGSGAIGELAAAEDEQRRLERGAAKAQLAQEQATFATAAAPHQALSVITNGLIAAALVDANFHRHQRHWRRRRVQER